MSTTPRTDAQILRYRASTLCPSEEVRFEGSQVVPADFARDLERENAELRKDKARLEEALKEAAQRFRNSTVEWEGAARHCEEALS